MEAPVGAFGSAFAREHARGVFALAFERKYTRRVRKFARYIFLQAPAQNFAPIFETRGRNFRYFGVAEAFGIRFYLNRLIAHHVHIFVGGIAGAFGVPLFQDAQTIAVEVFFKVFELLFQQHDDLFGGLIVAGIQQFDAGFERK